MWVAVLVDDCGGLHGNIGNIIIITYVYVEQWNILQCTDSDEEQIGYLISISMWLINRKPTTKSERPVPGF